MVQVVKHLLILSTIFTQRLTASQQEDLYVDLKIQDKLEMETKKKVTSGLDENGEQEAYTRDKLRGEFISCNMSYM